MKNELQAIAQNLELQTQELKPLQSGSELSLAINGKKIYETQVNEISQTIRYCMTLVGLRAANLPNELEKEVLLGFIRSNFGTHTLSEIKLAFSMAVSGKLSVEVNCFENFSCEYFGRIMTVYRKWAANEIKHIPLHEYPQLEMPKEADWSNAWNDILEAARAGKIETKIIGSPIYDWLDQQGIIKMEVEEKWVFIEKARSIYLAELKESFLPADVKLYAMLKADDWEKSATLRKKVILRAKVLAVKATALKMVIADQNKV